MTTKHLDFTSKFAVSETGAIQGTAWVFGTKDRVLDEIEPGAFAKVKLPIPMLYGHGRTEAIGSWTFAREEGGGLQVSGSINLDTARGKEVHSLLKRGDLTGLSIGFDPIEYAFKNDGGVLFKEVDLLEVSIVAVPAHPDARVTSVKSNARKGAVTPEDQVHDIRGEVAILKQRVSKLSATATPASDAKVQSLADMVEGLKSAVSIARNEATIAKEKALRAEEAADALAVQLGRPGATVHAQAGKGLSAVEKMGIICLGLARASEFGTTPLAEIAELGHGALAKEIETSRKTLNVSSAAAGGVMVPTPLNAEIIELLRPNVAFLAGNPRRVPMPSANFTIPKAASGASAQYSTEGEPAKVTEQSFQTVDLVAKTLKAIIPVTNDFLTFSLASASDFVQRDLLQAMAETMDYSAWYGDGLQGRPLGILNQSGITSNAATNSTTPTIANIDSDARKALNGLIFANVNLGSAKWVAHPRTWGYIADLRDGNGNLAFPTLQGTAPTFKGLPALSTTNLPINLGGGGNESAIILAAFDHVLLGEARGLELSISSQAAVEVNSVMISLFQRGMTAILATAQHDIGLRHAKAVSTLTAVKWGA